jgi:hypothetical protein
MTSHTGRGAKQGAAPRIRASQPEAIRVYNGYMAKPKLDPYLGYEEVAAHIGVSVRVVRKYLNEARRRRENGTSRTYDMPAPDKTFGQSPSWKLSTIEAWVKARPGRGSGGGPKARAAAEKLAAAHSVGVSNVA